MAFNRDAGARAAVLVLVVRSEGAVGPRLIGSDTDLMGLDDRNEGNEAEACPEHVWRMVGMTLDLDGTHIDSECERCGIPLVEGPGELAGKV